ncbi:MFS transporter [Martelella endophytica]|uniref:MFS transporter n=1 Tax=Martelella endophytica TaxID=1486262 RepID=A0A0D5LU51_MAREN|nr:MFS transporter [Martelella endophytica]AJY47591.1 MFS transporter [Martelella endophytica]
MSAVEEVRAAHPAQPTPQTADDRAPAAAQPSPPPLYPGAPPAQPPKPLPQLLLYMFAATVVGITQGLGMAFISVTLQQIAGPLQATTNEATWLVAAYLVPNASLTLMLFKMRQQFGLRRFAEISIVIYVLISLCHLWADSFQTALIVRFFAGVAAAPMSSIAILYMLEGLPREKKFSIGICAAMTVMSLATPLAGLISPSIMDIGGWRTFYIFEVGLAMISLALIFKLPLVSGERVKVISRADLIAFAFLFVGMGAFAAALTVGRVYWWTEKPWIGWMLIVGVACLTIMVVMEMNRENPLLDVRWITSAEILHFTGALLVFRIILSEQSSGARAFFMMLGLSNEQMRPLYIVIILSTIAAGVTCSRILKPGRVAYMHGFALVLLIIGTWLDSHSTSLTRPPQMFLSQTLIAFAAGLYLPPAMLVGLMSALKKGPNYILSFIIVFLTTQRVGGILGSALFGSFVTWREQVHSAALVQDLTSGDPLISQRITQLAGAYAQTITDTAVRNAEGAVQLASQVRTQAYVLAYNDAFRFLSLLACVALVVLIIDVAFETWEHKRAAAEGLAA